MRKMEIRHAVTSSSINSSSSTSSHSFEPKKSIQKFTMKSFIAILALITILIYLSFWFYGNIILIQELKEENLLSEQKISELKKERAALNANNDKLETDLKILEQQKKQLTSTEENIKRALLVQEKKNITLQSDKEDKEKEEEEILKELHIWEQRQNVYVYSIEFLSERIKRIINENK